MPHNRSVNRHPLSSLMLLVVFFIAGYIIFTFIAVFLCTLLFNKDINAFVTGDMDANMLRLMQGLISAGAFLLPPILLSLVERKSHYTYFPGYKKLPGQLLLFTIVVMFITSPFLGWTIKINQMMHLPDFLKGVENWMRIKEDLLDDLTKKLLMMHSVPELLTNLLIIAVIPAVGEELLFRGGIQNIISRWTGNVHLAIWITAILFSAIHVQFFGFFPRMLLGALFGYLFIWSKSIWVPITAHFFNNGTAVIGAFFLQREGKSLDTIDRIQASSTFLVISSGVLSILVLREFYRYSKKITFKDNEYEQ